MTPSNNGSNSKWLRIRQYREFWDVPRMFITELNGRTYLFNCRFDEKLEDFETGYSVFEMPDLSDADLSGSWMPLLARAKCKLGEIQIVDIEFDPTCRNEIAWESLQSVFARSSADRSPLIGRTVHSTPVGSTSE